MRWAARSSAAALFLLAACQGDVRSPSGNGGVPIGTHVEGSDPDAGTAVPGDAGADAGAPAPNTSDASAPNQPAPTADAGAGPAPVTDAGAAEPPAPAPRTVRFAVIGDYGSDDANEAAVARLVKGWEPDFVITVGDNNYPDGAASTMDANVGKYYAEFIGNYRGAYGPGSATNRFWPTLGNHDWVSGSEPYTDYFTLPGNERYYDVDLGLVHLFALDSQAQEPDGRSATSKQAAWLKPRLEASTACFDIVYFHEPPYSSSRYGGNTTMRWPFATWGADAVLAGHDHAYERLEANGIPHLVCGSSGGGLYTEQHIVPESRIRYAARHGAILATATDTGITFEFWNIDGQRIDAVTVPKSCK